MGSPPKWASPERGGPSGGHAPRKEGLTELGPWGGRLPPMAGRTMWDYSHMAKPRGLAPLLLLYIEGHPSSQRHPEIPLSLSSSRVVPEYWSCIWG